MIGTFTTDGAICTLNDDLTWQVSSDNPEITDRLQSLLQFAFNPSEHGVWAGTPGFLAVHQAAEAFGATPTMVEMEPEDEIQFVDRREKAFDPDEARDEHGRWTAGGGSVEVADKDKAEVNRLMEHIVGPGTTHEKVAQLVGAPAGAKVTITPNSVANRLEVKIDHPDFSAKRLMEVDKDGKKVMHNDWIKVPPEKQGQGIAREVFSHQVAEATKAGFDRIECRAAKSDEHNGYYTWPRMGYDAPLSDMPWKQEAIAAKFPDAKTVLDVMKAPGGSKWWKANGETIAHATFDLSSNSRSQKVLAAYNAEKTSKAPSGVMASLGRLFGLSKSGYDPDKETTMNTPPEDQGRFGEHGEEIDTAAWEDEALDAAWEKLFPGSTGDGAPASEQPE